MPTQLNLLSPEALSKLADGKPAFDIVVNGLESPEINLKPIWEVIGNASPPEAILADITLSPNTFLPSLKLADPDFQRIEGLTWLIERYILAFKKWTNIEPDRRVMREALEEFLMI